jgi:hypothetical protein
MNNKINIMPGFTAETSLYKTSGRYQMTSSTRRVELNANLVRPSLPIYMDGRFVCDGEITDYGVINCYPPSGGGGGGRPDLGAKACASCYRNCNKKPPAQRAACRADCDEFC